MRAVAHRTHSTSWARIACNVLVYLLRLLDLLHSRRYGILVAHILRVIRRHILNRCKRLLRTMIIRDWKNGRRHVGVSIGRLY